DFIRPLIIWFIHARLDREKNTNRFKLPLANNAWNKTWRDNMFNIGTVSGCRWSMAKRLALLACIGAGSAVMANAGAAESADKFPSHAIRFIVPYAAGGLPDTVARVVA